MLISSDALQQILPWSLARGIIFVVAPSIHNNKPKRYKDTTLNNINNTMSREEWRASDEREVKLACDELEDFGAIYRPPGDGETPQRTRTRKETIKRSIAAKKRRGVTTKKKKASERLLTPQGTLRPSQQQ